MRWIAAACLLIFGGHALAVKKIDRGVFVSARELAATCRVMLDVDENYDGGELFIRPATVERGYAVGRCMGYVEGVADEFREPIGTHHPYSDHPFSAGRAELPGIVQLFVKRVAEHPEEGDLAASTVLHEADKDLLLSCGDCSFGLLVYRGWK
jgi:hypothetical protein